MPTTETVHEVFHEGELEVQQRAGAAAQGRSSGRMIADTIIPGAIKFVKKQPFAIIGSVDRQQNLWASLVVGDAGFMTAEPNSLDLDLSQVMGVGEDPVWRNLADDPRVGILVIDLRSRARLRINGRVEEQTETRLRVAVEQAYPNCPQYIQRRIYRPATSPSQAQAVAETGTELNSDQRRWVASADTLFVASGQATGGIDASHRGGHPGFIEIVNSTRLRIPDYAGNGMFNTLGNFAVNPRAGLLVPDFENGCTLQLTGRAETLWDEEDPNNATAGTHRYWEFEIDHWRQTENSLPGSSEFLDYSPHNPVSVV